MSHSIQCTHCKAVLKSPTPVPAGKKVRCPKCKEVFTTPAEKPTTSVEKTTALGAPPPPPVKDPLAASKPAAIPNMEIPDPDEDLVAPDDEEPAEAGEILDEEEESSEREAPDDQDEEDDKPRKKSRAENETRPRKKSRNEDDDDDEDSPPRKKKRAEEDDEDDAPPRRAKKKRRDEENEDATDDEKPRSRGKAKKKSGGSLVWLLLLGGGVFLAITCCACLPIGYFALGLNSPKITGKWQEPGRGDAWEFRADGTGEHTFGKGDRDTFRYSVEGSELTLSFTEKIFFGMRLKTNPELDRMRYTIERSGDTLKLDSTFDRRTLKKVD